MNPYKDDPWKEAFSLFDMEGDWTIPTNELGIVMRALGHNPTQAELSVIEKEADPDGKGTVDYQTFLTMMTKKVHGTGTEEKLLQSFRVFVPEGNLISLRDLKHIVTHFGEVLSAEELEKMLSETEVDSDGMVNYEAFVKKMLGI